MVKMDKEKNKMFSAELKRQLDAGAGSGGKMFGLSGLMNSTEPGFQNRLKYPNGRPGGGGGGKEDDPEVEDPELPPTDDTGGGTTPSIGRPKSNSWPDIVGFYFPEGAGNYYKDGGLVRGGGKALRGRGRGRMR